MTFGEGEDEPESSLGPFWGRADLRAMSLASLDGVVSVDARGTILGWNPRAEAMFGWTEAEAIGAFVHELIIPEHDRAAHIRGMARAQTHGPDQVLGHRFERSALRKDGTEIPIELSVMLLGGTPEPVFVSFMRDLSERHHAAAQIEELQARFVHLTRMSAMGTMASMLAHELNQPLTAASNFLAAAERFLGLNTPERLDEVKAAVSQAKLAVVRAAETIYSVREMVESRPVRPKSYSMRQLLTDTTRLLGVRLGVRPTVRIDADADLVLVNKVQIEQVLLNLMRNAGEAIESQSDRVLNVLTSRKQGFVEVRVCDNGPGVPALEANGLFSPLSSDKPDGMGMGLSICRTIIEKHGGKIWYERCGPLTHFCFLVPAAEA